MKQIYDFEQHNPPVLNENMIRAKMEQRKLRWQTAWIALAGILAQVVLVLLGFFTMNAYPIITIFCVIYIVVSTTGGSVMAIVYTKKGGLSL